MKAISVELPSNRKFGLFFSAVFFVCCVYNVWQIQALWAWIFGTLAAVTIVLTLFVPDTLFPFNKLWAQIGLLLGRIVSPIVIAIIFFGMVTPIATLARLFGRDELRLRPVKGNSYWRQRTGQSIEPTSFSNQY